MGIMSHERIIFDFYLNFFVSPNGQVLDCCFLLRRSAFQCLQLVFTDFLPTIPYRCYPICVETASKFGSQRAELNVSLTAIGLLWNLSDYFFQNVSRLQVSSCC